MTSNPERVSDVTIPEEPSFQMDAQGHALISKESKNQILKIVIEAAKKSKKIFAFSKHYIDPNLFIQELEKSLE